MLSSLQKSDVHYEHRYFVPVTHEDKDLCLKTRSQQYRLYQGHFSCMKGKEGWQCNLCFSSSALITPSQPPRSKVILKRLSSIAIASFGNSLFQNGLSFCPVAPVKTSGRSSGNLISFTAMFWAWSAGYTFILKDKKIKKRSSADHKSTQAILISFFVFFSSQRTRAELQSSKEEYKPWK